MQQPGPTEKKRRLEIRPSRIACCGPIAKQGLPARGGYESANRRLIDDLRDEGHDVLELPYPVASGSKVRKAFSYMRRYASIAEELVRFRRRYDVLHITPLYRQHLHAEALLCWIAGAFDKKVLLDIRAGSFVRQYEQRGHMYRSTIDRLLRHVDVVAVEGEEYLPFVKARSKKPVIYLPNYVSDPLLDKPRTPAPSSSVRLIYVGRVVANKGVDTAIETLRVLGRKGVTSELVIVGTGDAEYLKALMSSADSLPIRWMGGLTPDETQEQLALADYFVFPTRHAGEGHSNALTEAMSEGVVPVCSTQGFNQSVVADAGRILSTEATADDYANAIAQIQEADCWSTLSEAARQRVSNNFSSRAVIPRLIAAYDSLRVGADSSGWPLS